MSVRTKNILLTTFSLLAIVASVAWIYYTGFKGPKHNVALHERVGQVMAELTAKAVGAKGRILLLTIPPKFDPELQTQLESFRKALGKLGSYDVTEHEFDPKDQPKYRLGSGLSGRRFVRAVKNYPKANAIVSFIGAPSLSTDEVAELTQVPKFIAETRSPEHLPLLFEKHIIQVAVVSRYVFPAPGPSKPKTPQNWFDKRYQIVTAEMLAGKPGANSE